MEGDSEGDKPSGTTVFRVQAGFSFSVLVFCMVMLATNKNPTYYLPIMTSIIGYWLPSPSYRGSKPVLPRVNLPKLPKRQQPPPPPDVDVEAPPPVQQAVRPPDRAHLTAPTPAPSGSSSA